jgi:hypothetical protein
MKKALQEFLIKPNKNTNQIKQQHQSQPQQSQHKQAPEPLPCASPVSIFKAGCNTGICTVPR